MRSSPALFLLVLAASCGADAPRETVVVAAATSLRDLLEETRAEFEAAHPGVALLPSYAASSTHARQIEAGAGFDVFLSADRETVERVAGCLETERTVFLSNRMALVAAADRTGASVLSPADIVALEGAIAIAAEPVPAGRYARAWLRRAGLLTRLEPRFVVGRNARATLALVESGAAEFGLVYASDAERAPDVATLWRAEAGDPPRIAYVAALRDGAAPAARAFVLWLEEERFQEAARAFGFLRPEPGAAE